MAVSELVVLKGGVSVLLPAFRLALALEDRGFTFRVLDDGRLEVQPSRDLTADDCAAIREYKAELVRILTYEAKEQ